MAVFPPDSRSTNGPEYATLEAERHRSRSTTAAESRAEVRHHRSVERAARSGAVGILGTLAVMTVLTPPEWRLAVLEIGIDHDQVVHYSTSDYWSLGDQTQTGEVEYYFHEHCRPYPASAQMPYGPAHRAGRPKSIRASGPPRTSRRGAGALRCRCRGLSRCHAAFVRCRSHRVAGT